jgi:uncharacterized protein YbjT (DUF2867 family)
MSNKTAVVAGATGLVGKELVSQMLANRYYEKVIVLARKNPQIGEDPRLKVVIIKDFGKLDEHKADLNANHVYCCLGTTMKAAGSKENFKKIDLEYPVKMARLAMEQPDFETYFVVTSVGSNPDSPLFYNEVKGYCEKELIALNMHSLQIFRPSLLLGKRKEFRFGEEVAKALSGVLSFFVVGNRRAHLWSISGKDVAKSMLVIAKEDKSGVSIYAPKDMIELAL